MKRYAYFSLAFVVAVAATIALNSFEQHAITFGSITASSTTYSTAGTFTYVVSTNACTTVVDAWGGGGAGFTGNSGGGGAGGGGGAFASSTLNLASGDSYSLTVGAGGASSAAAGADSTFDTTVVVADGGTGGSDVTTGVGTGGTVANSTGTVKNDGGNGGQGANGSGNNDQGGGGGGAGGPHADGNVGSNASSSLGGDGGQGDGTSGGAGGTNVSGGAGNPGTANANGGGGGAGGDNGAGGGQGGAPGAGGGGGEGGFGAGAAGQIKITELIDSAGCSPTVVLNSPADASSDSDTTPTLNFTGTDTYGADDLEYNVQVDTVNTFDSQASISLDAASVSAVLTANPSTLPHTVTTTGENVLLIVGVALNRTGSNPATTTAVTYGGVPMVKARSDNKSVVNSTDTSIWFLFNPPTGTNDVSATFSAVTGVVIVAASYTGAQQSNTPDAIGGATGTTNGSQSLSITTIANNAWIFAVAGSQMSSNPPTISANQTSRGTVVGTFTTYGAEDTNGGVTAGANSMGFTFGGTMQSFAMTGASFAPATIPLLDKFSDTDTGFTAGHPFTSGAATDFIVQAADELTAGVEYFWRVRAIDPTGSNTYGDWSSTRNFTVTAGVTPEPISPMRVNGIMNVNGMVNVRN